MKTTIFYGWYIAIFTFFSNFLAIGSGFYIFNAFMEPLCQAHGWSRTDVNLALLIGMLFGILSQLIYGTLVVRIGARILMTIGPLVSGIAFIFLFRSHDLLSFYLLSIVLFMGNGSFSAIVSGTVVNNWFIEKRGKALGISTAGVSFSGAIMPFAAMLLYLKYGLETASFSIGLFLILFAPLSFLIVRNWPEEYGLIPDGEKIVAEPEQPNEKRKTVIKEDNNLDDWTLKKLLRTPSFWKLGLTYGLTLIGVVGVMSQLKPRFSDVGFDDKTAMAMMAATAFIGAIGKYVWGTLCDRYESKKVVALLITLNALGLSFALVKGSLWPMIAFIIIFGFSMGGVMSTYPICIGDLFGRKSFPTVMKYLSVFFLLEITGFIISGQSFDRTGSYDLAYMIYIFLFLVSIFLVLSIKRPEMK